MSFFCMSSTWCIWYELIKLTYCVCSWSNFMLSKLLEPCAGCKYNSETDLITASKRKQDHGGQYSYILGCTFPTIVWQTVMNIHLRLWQWLLKELRMQENQLNHCFIRPVHSFKDQSQYPDYNPGYENSDKFGMKMMQRKYQILY